ncbi:MAG TPA: NUDIX domain-containing protein [Candidatus Binatia bacterium]|nr:NUDIX domain-containing protein [Candidatus Binatia bacterium]
MRSIEIVRNALSAREPRLVAGSNRAAVAIVLHDTPTGVDLLLIERARRFGDPWSGQMAFPGGRVDARDRDDAAAAERETLEEVGLDLAGAERLGRLDDVRAGIPLVAPLVLCAFVYRIEERPALALNHEVEAAFWVASTTCAEPARHTGWSLGPLRLPGVCVGTPGRHVVWGLTYRLLDSLFGVVGAPFGR